MLRTINSRRISNEKKGRYQSLDSVSGTSMNEIRKGYAPLPLASLDVIVIVFINQDTTGTVTAKKPIGCYGCLVVYDW